MKNAREIILILVRVVFLNGSSHSACALHMPDDDSVLLILCRQVLIIQGHKIVGVYTPHGAIDVTIIIKL
jgi:hypothetical protein